LRGDDHGKSALEKIEARVPQTRGALKGGATGLALRTLLFARVVTRAREL
jgi:hypothetical protein